MPETATGYRDDDTSLLDDVHSGGSKGTYRYVYSMVGSSYCTCMRESAFTRDG